MTNNHETPRDATPPPKGGAENIPGDTHVTQKTVSSQSGLENSGKEAQDTPLSPVRPLPSITIDVGEDWEVEVVAIEKRPIIKSAIKFARDVALGLAVLWTGNAIIKSKVFKRARDVAEQSAVYVYCGARSVIIGDGKKTSKTCNKSNDPVLPSDGLAP